MGMNGQQVLVWSQSNGTQSVLYGATSATATGTFAVQEIGALSLFGETVLSVADNGDALLMNRYYAWRVRWVGGAWQASSALPSNRPSSAFLSCSHARNGNFLCVATSSFGEGNTGRWTSYDASRNVMVQAAATTSPGSGYVLGLNTISVGVGYAAPLLSVSGVSAITLQNRFDVLPTPASPAGDGRAVDNLWGVFLK